MGLIIPPDLISSLKHKHLLLDTNVFIDASKHPAEFADFFNTLKDSNITVVTIDCVKMEFLRGAPDENKYKEKESYFNSITTIILPTDPEVVKNSYELIKRYKEQGGTVAFTDFHLGANLMRYKSNIFLLSKNTTELPLTIFDLKFIINYPLNKGIFTYGVYQIKI
jgi:predicted nucleic acid-binding protein